MYNIQGSIGTTYSVKSTNYTLTEADNVIVVNTQAVIQTLPEAILFDGVDFTIANASDGNITIATTLSQLINGELTLNLISGSIVKVKAVNGAWIILSRTILEAVTMGKVFVTTKGFNKL